MTLCIISYVIHCSSYKEVADKYITTTKPISPDLLTVVSKLDKRLISKDAFLNSTTVFPWIDPSSVKSKRLQKTKDMKVIRLIFVAYIDLLTMVIFIVIWGYIS